MSASATRFFETLRFDLGVAEDEAIGLAQRLTEMAAVIARVRDDLSLQDISGMMAKAIAHCSTVFP